MAFVEASVFIIGIYGLFRILLFLLRYYLIYILAKKLLNLWKQIKFKDKPYTPPPTNREDEKLRDEEKEREVEKIEVQRMGEARKTEKNGEQNATQEQDFTITVPKAVGKWTKLILGQRQNLIVAIAQRMQANKSANFWQNYVQVQKEQEQKGRSRL